MQVQLNDIAKRMRFGPYEKPEEEGELAYLQVRHFDKLNRLVPAEVDSFVNRSDKTEPHVLKPGDLLFASKGYRNFAWAYDPAVGPAVASSVFYVIHVDRKRVLPEYLATVINTTASQAHFVALSAGSNIQSVRKSELGVFPVHVPDMETQQRIINLRKHHERDMDLSHSIIREKQRLYDEVVGQLLIVNC